MVTAEQKYSKYIWNI